jgi:hypothetical protein
MGILVVSYILELARIWLLHCQGNQHTHIETYIKPNRDHTFNYIYQSNITQRVHHFNHKAYVSSNYYTKNKCYLTQCCRPKPSDGRRQVIREPGGPEPLSVGLAARTRPEVGVRWACHLTYT